MTDSGDQRRASTGTTANILMAGFVVALVLACSSEQDVTGSRPDQTVADASTPAPAAAEPAHVATPDTPSQTAEARPQTSFEAALIERLDTLQAAVDALQHAMTDHTETLGQQLTAVAHIEEALTPQIEALGAGQQALGERLADLATRLDRLKPTPLQATPAAAKPASAAQPAAKPKARPKTPRPPFVLEAVETWNGTPQAVLNTKGRLITLGEGDTASGWRIDAIRYPNRITVVHQRSGRKRELHCHG